MALKMRLPALRRAGHEVNVLQQTSRSSSPDAGRREKGNIKSRSVRRAENVFAALDALASNYSSILRPISVNAPDGILNRSRACPDLRHVHENNDTPHRAS